jgi:hypothetical protein
MSDASAAGPPACGLGSTGYQCTYNCENSDDDVSEINAAIATVAIRGGGVVNLKSGTCHVGKPILFQKSWSTPYPNVWLRGAGSGANGTLLQRTGFTLQGEMIEADIGLGSWPTNHDIKITDMTIDPGPLELSTVAAQATGSGSLDILLPNSGAAAQLGLSYNFCQRNNCAGSGIGVYDLSNPRALVLPAAGNIATINAGNGVSDVTLTSPSAGPVAKGDILVFCAGGGGIIISYANRVTINNVNMIHGGNIILNGDNSFTVSNSSFSTDDDLEVFYSMGYLQTVNWAGRTGINDGGLILNNKFFHTGMEIDSSDTVVSGNDVTSTFNGGINGSAGKNDIFEGNLVHDSLDVIAYAGYSVPYNHDYLVNQGMQIWNGNALINNNIVYRNGGAGILSGGSSNIISANVVYDNAISPVYNGGRGGSGIVVQGAGEPISNTLITRNQSCNTAGNNPDIASPDCISGSGTQQFAFQLVPSIKDVSISNDNQFWAGQVGLVGRRGVTTGVTYSNGVQDAEIVASPCHGPANGVCTSDIQWKASNVHSARVYVRDTSNPAALKLLSSNSAGSYRATLSERNIGYVFSIMDGEGQWLASVTIQPTAS